MAERMCVLSASASSPVLVHTYSLNPRHGAISARERPFGQVGHQNRCSEKGRLTCCKAITPCYSTLMICKLAASLEISTLKRHNYIATVSIYCPFKLHAYLWERRATNCLLSQLSSTLIDFSFVSSHTRDGLASFRTNTIPITLLIDQMPSRIPASRFFPKTPGNILYGHSTGTPRGSPA
jgi:hypothetical protein